MRRVFHPRLFTYRVQQHQKRKTQSFVIRARGKPHHPLVALASETGKSHSSASRISLSVSLTIHLILFLFAIQAPRFINRVVPKYPPLAKRTGKEGVVILTTEIGIDGTARNIEVVQGLGYGCVRFAHRRLALRWSYG